MVRRVITFSLLLLSTLLLNFNFIQATPYWTEQEYQTFQQIRLPQSTERIVITPSEVDNFSLLFEYIQICDFLAAMQEPDPLDPEYGGMHEGETPELWAIVQTDNTQEAIRVWCTYGQLSGDLETYRDNIEAAWIYTMNYPAYAEEGSESDYYRVHNCGWGLVAETKYREVYGDDNYLWYADSCAAYIQGHRLGYSGFGGYYDSLHPLVEGWGAGTLYDYGIEQNDQDAVDHAITVGSDVMDWIDANPTRLADNEVWAMSGGTAMWGVCRSVLVDDPATGQSWLPTVLPYMDTYAGLGEWNNSWNIWYAHAYHAAASVMNDPTLTGLAYALVDTLLDADTDNDGGIMATSTDPDSADQSWVSCYLDYMGLEALIAELPNWDAGALRFLAPDTSYPIATGEPAHVVVTVGNTGLEYFGDVTVDIMGPFSATGSVTLDFADVDTLDFGQWTPITPGQTALTMVLSPGGDLNSNDTLVFPVHVLGWGELSGTISDAITGDPIGGEATFYLEDFPSSQPLFTANISPQTGQYSITAIEGHYRICIDPEIPYTSRIDLGQVANGQTTVVDFDLYPAPTLLVDDDGGSLYETYFYEPLLDAEYDVYLWDVNELGVIGDNIDLFDAVIWFTGNEAENTLTPAEVISLQNFLNSGGNLLLTGQNIAADIDGDPFLHDYLGIAFEENNAGQQIVKGLPGDPICEGDSLFFIGAGGAGNQTSPDAISATGEGILTMAYALSPNPGAAVRVEGDFKSLFLAFGLEAVSGAAFTMPREEYLVNVMEWFEIPTVGIVPEETLLLPRSFRITSLYPNPFNPAVEIEFSLPVRDDLNLQVFDLQGRLVQAVMLGWLQSGYHTCNYQFSPEASSGVYYFLLEGKRFKSTACGVLIK